MLFFRPNIKGKIALATFGILLLILAYAKRKKLKLITINTYRFLHEKTWDIISDQRINNLHPKIRNAAKEFILRAEKDLGIKLRVVSGLRTWEEQNELYAKGRTAGGNVVTNAKAGDSLHNYGLALDVVEIKDAQALWNNPNWKKIANLGKSLGFDWGGDWAGFRDKPHFEMRFGHSIAQLRKLYTRGNRTNDYVNIT